jgi:chemotaxis protein methyltransferase CheR
MTDRECVAFLKWSLPQLQMRWQGFRKVRGQVCKRIDRRLAELGLPDVAAYRKHLEANASEWETLDALCSVTISRFYRDQEIFRILEQDVFPSLCKDAEAQGCRELRSWSIGCASGEEPYTLALVWDHAVAGRFPQLSLTILATDHNPLMIERARTGCYRSGSFAALPPAWRTSAFVREGELWCIRNEVRSRVSFRLQDIRKTVPEEHYHLILCRNAAFTYFGPALQQDMLGRISERLLPGGVLVIGVHESLPAECREFIPWQGNRSIFRKAVIEDPSLAPQV